MKKEIDFEDLTEEHRNIFKSRNKSIGMLKKYYRRIVSRYDDEDLKMVQERGEENIRNQIVYNYILCEILKATPDGSNTFYNFMPRNTIYEEDKYR